MRPTWKGSISFGLVYIPIAVYPATREEKLSFRQLRKTDLSPIKYKKVAEADMKEVPATDIVKGFEYERGRYIVLNDEDFEKVRIESTHSIDITDFVDLGRVDPKFFYKPYFLEAQKGGEKAYALLHKALSGTGKIGIAKVVISNREYLAAVKPDGLFLVLELMHFAEERPQWKGLSAEEPAEHDRARWSDERDRLQIRRTDAWQQPVEKNEGESGPDDGQIKQAKDRDRIPMKLQRISFHYDSDQEQRRCAENHLPGSNHRRSELHVARF